MTGRISARGTVFALAAALAAAAVAAPLLTAGGRLLPGLGLYAGFSAVCHQQAERSWLAAGYPLAVCVRCLGFYLGCLAGAAWRGRPAGRRELAAAALLLALTWAAESSGLWTPPEAVRLASGAVLGWAAAPLALTGTSASRPAVLASDRESV